MIDLHAKRDDAGRYELQEVLKGSKQEQSANEYGVAVGNGSYHIFWITTPDNKHVLCKYDTDMPKPVGLHGELLFEQFAKQNGIDCANIDVVSAEGQSGILSQDVTHGDEKLISFTQIHDANGHSFDEEYPLCIDYIMENLPKFCEAKGIELDEGMRHQLVRLAMVDYVCGQSDRNASNILFVEKSENGKKMLKLAPMIDNEMSFGFSGLLQALDKKGTVAKEDVELALDEAIDQPPYMGISTPTDEKSGSHIFMHELAQELARDPQLLGEYKNLKLDVPTLAQRVKEETGYEIDKLDVDYARQMVEYRKKELDDLLEKTMAEQKEQ